MHIRYLLQWKSLICHKSTHSKKQDLISHPRFTQLQEELKQSEDFQNIYNDNKGLFSFISKNAGQNITDVVELDYVYDTLFIEHNNNMTLPDWAQRVFFNPKFKELRDFSFTIDTYTPELKRLKGGPFIKKVLADCDKVGLENCAFCITFVYYSMAMFIV